MAKISDVFGRLEAFSISVALHVVGYVQQAVAKDVNTFASAQIFYAAGQTGLQILIQIFIADTTSLTWRAFFSSIIDIPYLVTVWIGPVIAGWIRANTSWRWGYGIWAAILPVAFMPLAFSLLLNYRKLKRIGPRSKRGEKISDVLRNLWYELDFFGLVLLCAAVSLILLPLTLAPEAKGGWKNSSMVTMIAVGVICLFVFPLWERSPRLAPHAFFPRELIRQRTALVGVSWAFWYFSKFTE